MKKQILPVATITLIGLVLTGCSSIGPVTSTPPVKAFTLEKPTTFTFSLVGSKATLPIGEYKPVFEDKKLYYYAAPTKIPIRDLGSFAVDGGLVLERNHTTPSKWYYINNMGQINRLKLPAEVEVKPVD